MHGMGDVGLSNRGIRGYAYVLWASFHVMGSEVTENQYEENRKFTKFYTHILKTRPFKDKFLQIGNNC